MENGKWKTENGKRETGKWETENGKRRDALIGRLYGDKTQFLYV